MRVCVVVVVVVVVASLCVNNVCIRAHALLIRKSRIMTFVASLQITYTLYKVFFARPLSLGLSTAVAYLLRLNVCNEAAVGPRGPFIESRRYDTNHLLHHCYCIDARINFEKKSPDSQEHVERCTMDECHTGPFPRSPSCRFYNCDI